MNYKIINNEALFRTFISWLPALDKQECFYVTLMARKKYCKDLPDSIPKISRDKAQLRRFTVCDISTMYDKVKQLECELGAYKSGGLPVPNEALALYITPNPRDMIKATKESLILFANRITEQYSGYNPHQEVMSVIQKSCSRKCVVCFDFDTDRSFDSLWKEVKLHVNFDSVSAIKTRGGYHILVHPALVNPEYRDWYKGILSMGCEAKGDSLIPIVGCCQGGHTPVFLAKTNGFE